MSQRVLTVTNVLTNFRVKLSLKRYVIKKKSNEEGQENETKNINICRVICSEINGTVRDP